MFLEVLGTIIAAILGGLTIILTNKAQDAPKADSNSEEFKAILDYYKAELQNVKAELTQAREDYLRERDKRDRLEDKYGHALLGLRSFREGTDFKVILHPDVERDL